MSRKGLPLTAAALIGFVGNSLLCRLALRSGAIDAMSFTAIRLASGAVVLAALVRATLPMAAAALALSLAGGPGHLTVEGALLAATSGSVTSGLGYALWYRALPGLTAAKAASVQLSVPVFAAAAGVALLGEPFSRRLVASAALILGGIAPSVLLPRGKG